MQRSLAAWIVIDKDDGQARRRRSTLRWSMNCWTGVAASLRDSAGCHVDGIPRFSLVPNCVDVDTLEYQKTIYG
jgi:hypothetical protein